MHWYNEPPSWRTRDGLIQVKTGAKTDFWRKTHYDFIRDNGHFYYQLVTGNFTAEVKITGLYIDLYDQAGLMLRQDENTWLKCGIEFVDGVQQASVVMTREYSDWSVVPLLQNPSSLWLRLQRNSDTVQIYYSLDGESYTLLRLAYFPQVEAPQIGLMCASPQGNGFLVDFEQFKILMG